MLIREDINTRLSEYSILNATSTNIQIELTNYIIHKKLEIKVHQSFASPTKAFNRFFGVGETFDINASAQTLIMEPEQFIRDIDFLRENIDLGAIRVKIDEFLAK